MNLPQQNKSYNMYELSNRNENQEVNNYETVLPVSSQNEYTNHERNENVYLNTTAGTNFSKRNETTKAEKAKLTKSNKKHIIAQVVIGVVVAILAILLALTIVNSLNNTKNQEELLAQQNQLQQNRSEMLTEIDTEIKKLQSEIIGLKTNATQQSVQLSNLGAEIIELKRNAIQQSILLSHLEAENHTIPYSSCSDIYGTAEDNGIYLINPNPNNLAPFYVFCDFSGNVAETVIRHDSMDEIEFTGCEPAFCYTKNITYSATLQQITALVEKSKNCRQFIKLRCIGVVIQFSGGRSYAGWLSRNGSRQSYWGGATSRRPHYCACGESGSCSDSENKCNCDRNDATLRSDEGFLTYKDHLPVTELQFGDTGNSGEMGWHTLGPLICSD